VRLDISAGYHIHRHSNKVSADILQSAAGYGVKDNALELGHLPDPSYRLVQVSGRWQEGVVLVGDVAAVVGIEPLQTLCYLHLAGGQHLGLVEVGVGRHSPDSHAMPLIEDMPRQQAGCRLEQDNLASGRSLQK
jgi:hypothetical protein